MSVEINLSKLHDVLKKELFNAKELHKLLQAENKALANNDSDALVRINEEKIGILEALEVSGKVRHQVTDALGEDKLSTWIASQHNSALSATWSELETTLRKCRKANEVNGMVVHISMQNTRQLLDIMKGKSPDQNTYDRSGNLSTNPQGNAQTKA